MRSASAAAEGLARACSVSLFGAVLGCGASQERHLEAAPAHEVETAPAVSSSAPIDPKPGPAPSSAAPARCATGGPTAAVLARLIPSGAASGESESIDLEIRGPRHEALRVCRARVAAYAEEKRAYVVQRACGEDALPAAATLAIETVSETRSSELLDRDADGCPDGLPETASVIEKRRLGSFSDPSTCQKALEEIVSLRRREYEKAIAQVERAERERQRAWKRCVAGGGDASARCKGQALDLEVTQVELKALRALADRPTTCGR